MNGTYDANNNGWYEEYRALEQTLGNLDNTLSAFGGAGFRSISEKVDRLWDAFEALAFCRENLEYELFMEIDEKLMKQFGEMTDEFATLDVRNIRTPNVLGIKGINVGYDAEGRVVSETVGGEVNYLTLENFTGAAGFDRISGYKEQCITGFSKMLENQYDYYVEEGILDRSVKLWEYLDGMMPREFEYSQYTEVWKKTVHSFLDVLVVPTMVEAVTGVEFITGDHLTDNEQEGKAVQSLIQAVSIGMTAGGAYSKGLTYVTAGKMQSSQISKYVACKVMKSVAEDGVMNMVTTELTEHDCELAARVLMFASMYVGMQEASDFVDRYVENGGLVKSNGGLIADARGMKTRTAGNIALKIGNNEKSVQNLTKEEILNALDGVTEKSTEIARKIRNKDIGINILGDELFESYLGYSSDMVAMQIGDQIYVRSSSSSLISDVVHEGTHAIDYFEGMKESDIVSCIGETRAYSEERIFQIKSGIEVQFPSEDDMMVHIWSNYKK